MSKSLKEMLIGVILGDVHIGRTGIDKAFVSFEQSSKKMNYLSHLQELAKEGGLPLLNDSVKEYTRNDSRYNVTNSSLYFRSESIESLRPIADLFLDESGKKQIPSNIAEHLTPRGLAFWIMDDGQRVKNGGVTLCTDSFATNEISILREALKSNFNLETSIHNKKGRNDANYERIYIKKDEAYEELKTSLIPHMHESMLYKINEGVDLIQDTSDFVPTETEIEMDLDIFDN